MGNCWASDPLLPVRVRSRRKEGAYPPQDELELNNSKSDVNDVINLLAATKDVEDLRLKSSHGNVSIFTHNELRLSTKNFRQDQILGQGGFGTVYKGMIDESIRPGFQSTQVAVKVLNPESIQGDKEWLDSSIRRVVPLYFYSYDFKPNKENIKAEVNYLGQFSHPNLVKLIGYCCEGEHRLLVYEYMACGSLEKHLFRRVSLMTWSTRMKIALGAANGLAFLHGVERPIIYRDFKTSNILLDADYNAKLSDFGLAKEGPIGDQTHVSTRVMGTYGYAAPEYVMTGHLTSRSDVYGFGVVLLEMLIGRQAMDKSRPSREHNLVEWARPLLIHNRKLLKILDPRVDGQYSIRSAQKLAHLAYQCLSQNPKGRPTMSQVVDVLESIRDLSDEVVTLYDASKDTSLDDDTSSFSEEARRQGIPTCRRRPGDGRSRSEPPKEYSLGSPSPNSSTLATSHARKGSLDEQHTPMNDVPPM